MANISTFSQVCVDYKDPKILQEEAEEGRRLGFDGKVRFINVLAPGRECLTGSYVSPYSKPFILVR
jgi:hypothetical protein